MTEFCWCDMIAVGRCSLCHKMLCDEHAVKKPYTGSKVVSEEMPELVEYQYEATAAAQAYQETGGDRVACHECRLEAARQAAQKVVVHWPEDPFEQALAKWFARYERDPIVAAQLTTPANIYRNWQRLADSLGIPAAAQGTGRRKSQRRLGWSFRYFSGTEYDAWEHETRNRLDWVFIAVAGSPAEAPPHLTDGNVLREMANMVRETREAHGHSWVWVEQQ